MNLKKKLRKFFTLSPRANAGFTLVELIVVIAILAILAGIGVPAYSGYVEKANKQADISLASEVENALILYYYSHPETTSGYVVLGTPADADDVGDNAMQAVFGEGWAQTASLSYDGWEDASAMLAWAANNLYADSVSDSTYFTTVGTEALLSDVQNCASKLAELLDGIGWSGSVSANTLYAKIQGVDTPDVENAIWSGMDSADITADVLANATVFGIASELNKENKATTTVQNFGEDGYLGTALDRGMEETPYYTSPTQVNLTDFANTYAALEAFVNFVGKENTAVQEAWKTYNTTTMNSGDWSEIANGLNSTCATIMTKAGDAYNKYYDVNERQFEKDGEAYVGMMQAVNGLSGDYADRLNQNGLFTNSDIADRVNSYVAVSGLGEVPSVSGSAIIAILSVENGVPVVRTSIDHLLGE